MPETNEKYDVIKYIRPFTWAWLIIIGGLMIFPGGSACIVCGAFFNKFFAVGSIILGGMGFYYGASTQDPIPPRARDNFWLFIGAIIVFVIIGVLLLKARETESINYKAYKDINSHVEKMQNIKAK